MGRGDIACPETLGRPLQKAVVRLAGRGFHPVATCFSQFFHVALTQFEWQFQPLGQIGDKAGIGLRFGTKTMIEMAYHQPARPSGFDFQPL